MIQATQMKRGMCIARQRALPRRKAQHTPGTCGAGAAKIRNLKNGAISEHRFRSVDMVERAILDDGDGVPLPGRRHTFMNNETFEQIAVNEVLGTRCCT
jgi:elongation factor P